MYILSSVYVRLILNRCYNDKKMGLFCVNGQDTLVIVHDILLYLI